MDATGRDPGSPRQTPQTRVFGGAVVDGAQRQKALVSVLSWTWHSTPITGRKPCVVVSRRATTRATRIVVWRALEVLNEYAAVRSCWQQCGWQNAE